MLTYSPSFMNLTNFRVLVYGLGMVNTMHNIILVATKDVIQKVSFTTLDYDEVTIVDNHYKKT